MIQSTLFLLNQASILIEKGSLDTAVIYLKQAIKISPKNPEAHRLLGVVYAIQKKYIEANTWLDKSLLLDSKNFITHSNKGNVLKELRDFEGSLKCHNKSLQLNKNYFEAWSNKGNTYFELNDFDKAVECHARALEINENYADGWNNMATALHALNNVIDAEIAYKRAINLSPFNAKYQENLSHLLLENFNFEIGWKMYESRFKSSFKSKKIISDRPEWDGTQKNNTLLIWCEQGVGDQILYSSMFADLESFPQKKIISVNRKLLTIFQRSFPKFTFIEEGKESSEVSYNEHIAMGNLGKYFRKNLSSFPKSRESFLSVDANKTIHFCNKINHKSGLICGIAWKSSNPIIGTHKSIELSSLFSTLIGFDFNFINLQYGDVADEINSVEHVFNQSILNFENVNGSRDLDEFSSLVNCCDFIVTTSNTTAHFGGALGKKVFLLAPYSVGKLWYWSEISGQCIWYPGIKIYRQDQHGDWTKPLAEIKFDLKKLIEQYDKNYNRF